MCLFSQLSYIRFMSHLWQLSKMTNVWLSVRWSRNRHMYILFVGWTTITNKGGTQRWTGDLLICSQTLYHWATPPTYHERVRQDPNNECVLSAITCPNGVPQICLFSQLSYIIFMTEVNDKSLALCKENQKLPQWQAGMETVFYSTIWHDLSFSCKVENPA